MKIFPKKIKPAVVSLIILVGLLGVSYGAFAQLGSHLVSFITSQGLQTKYGRLVIVDPVTSTDPSDQDPSNSIDEPWLPDLRLFVDDKTTSFAGLTSEGEVHVTPPTGSSTTIATFGASELDEFSTVSVDGNILATDFVDYNNNFTSLTRLCSNSSGVVESCGTASVCGNGVVETGEQCDDGNTTAGDGCSATCQIEVPICGNGVVETGEQCDDGNTEDGDACSSTCTDTLHLWRVGAKYCQFGTGPHEDTQAYSIILSDDVNNPNEVSGPSTDPDYNPTFVKKWEWQTADSAMTEFLSSQQYGELFVFDGDKSFSDVQTAMAPRNIFTEAESFSGYQTEPGPAYLSEASSGTQTYPEGESIYRIRALDDSDNPVTDWRYVNTLAPAAVAYDSTNIDGVDWVDGADLLSNANSTLNEDPELVWTNSYTDTSDMQFFTYTLQRRESSSSVWANIASSTPDNPRTSFTDGGFSSLYPGTYEYRIRVEKGCGWTIPESGILDDSYFLGTLYGYSNVVSVNKTSSPSGYGG